MCSLTLSMGLDRKGLQSPLVIGSTAYYSHLRKGTHVTYAILTIKGFWVCLSQHSIFLSKEFVQCLWRQRQSPPDDNILSLWKAAGSFDKRNLLQVIVCCARCTPGFYCRTNIFPHYDQRFNRADSRGFKSSILGLLHTKLLGTWLQHLRWLCGLR